MSHKLSWNGSADSFSQPAKRMHTCSNTKQTPTSTNTMYQHVIAL